MYLMRNTSKIIGGKEVSSQITWNFSTVTNYEKKKFSEKEIHLKEELNSLRQKNAELREEIK